MNIPVDVLISSLVSLFLLIATGYAVVRTGLIPVSVTGPFAALLLNVALPATIFSSMIREFDPRFLTDSVIIIAASFIMYLIIAVLGIPGSRIFGVKKEVRGTWMQGMTYPNTGFMGFPIILALLGEDALALAVMANISFNLLVYSLGVKQILADNKSASAEGAFSFKKILCTMINFSIVLGLIFFCLQLPVPGPAMSAVRFLANLTTPLSMIVVGMNIGKSSISEVFKDKDAFTASLMRLVITPVAMWALLKLVPFGNPLIAPVLLITMAMPAASVGCVLAEKYGGSPELASHISFLSALLCIVTIPLICMLP